MIKRNSLLAIFCFIFVFSITCQSAVYTTFPPDSIRVKWMEGKKYILHKVEPKETWQHLARRYKCTVADLKTANEGVEELKVGQIINVPSFGSEVAFTPLQETNARDNTISVKSKTDSPQKESPMPATFSIDGSNPVTYTVKKGDTMYSIAKKFNKTVQEIKAVNKLTSDVLASGQVLIIGSTSAKSITPVKTEANAVPAPAVKEEKPVILSPNARMEPAEKIATKPIAETKVSPAAGLEKPTKSISPLKKGNTGKTLMQVTETGVATWIQDGQVNPDKYYALHRSAPIGTIIKVTNRMNNQFVYVKVVGSLPDTGENENIIIKVSQAVSSKLNALDPLFQVELSYGMMN